MTQLVAQLVSKSQRGLRAAIRLFESEDYDFCVSRAYYAMFYMAEALLLTKNLVTSKHSSLLTLLFEHFVKTGILEKSLHQDLHHAFQLRQQGDYWAESAITREMAEDLLNRAERFIATLEAQLTP